MDNTNIKNISFNYYLNTTSYVKTVLDILPDEEVSKEKKALIMELFNYIFSTLNREELADVTRVSLSFQEKLSMLSPRDILIQAEYIYKNFLERMLFDSYNRLTYFNIMNECIKVSSGCYQEINDSNFYTFNDNAVDNIRIM